MKDKSMIGENFAFHPQMQSELYRRVTFSSRSFGLLKTPSPIRPQYRRRPRQSNNRLPFYILYSILCFISVLIFYIILHYNNNVLFLQQSIKSIYKAIIYDESSLNSPMLCDEKSIQSLRGQISSLHTTLVSDTPCKVKLLSQNFSEINQEENLSLPYRAVCGSSSIDWTFQMEVHQKNGCEVLDWSLVFTQTNLSIPISAWVLGFFFSFVAIILSVVITEPMNLLFVAIMNHLLFHILSFSGRVWPSYIRPLCGICNFFTISVLISETVFDISSIVPNRWLFAFIPFYPMLMSLLSSCPSFGNPLTAFRSSFAMMFGDSVYPALLELTTTGDISSVFGLILSFVYVPLNLLGVVSMMGQFISTAKQKLFDFQR